MRNATPLPIRCAVCGRTGPVSLFMRGGEFINWVEAKGGTYVVCNEHIDSVYVVDEDALHGQPFVHTGPTFYATGSLRDLETRLGQLEDRFDQTVLNLLESIGAGRSAAAAQIRERRSR